MSQIVATRGGAQPASIVRVEVAITGGTIMCTVRSDSNADYLNEANIWILKSTLRNAGLGLF